MFREKTLLGLILAVLSMMIGVGMIVAILPQKVVALDGNGRSVGYIASAFAFSYLLLQIPLGRLSDRIGFKRLLIAGYLLCFIAGLVFYLARSSSTIFIARLLQGAGEAPVWTLAPALLSLKFPSNKGKVMGSYNAAFHLGLTLGPFAGILTARLLNDNSVFLVYSLGCLAGAAAIALLVENPSCKKGAAAGSPDIVSLLETVKQRQVLICSAGIILYGAGYGSFLTAIPAYLVQEKKFGSIGIGLFFSLFYMSVCLSQVIAGPLADSFGRNRFMISGLLITAAGLIITPFLGLPLILPVLTAASLGAGVFHLASLAFLNESVPDSLKGTISGVYYLFWGVGMFLGPPVLTAATASISFQAAIAGYSLLLVLAALGILKLLGWKDGIRK